jgi:hypothetical protein
MQKRGNLPTSRNSAPKRPSLAGFYINLPIGGVAAILLACIYVPEQAAKPPFSLATVRDVVARRLDLPGLALFAPAATMLLLALGFGSSDGGDGGYGWSSPTTIGLFCGGGVAALAFCWWERREGDRAMMPWPMLRRRVVRTSCLQYCLLMVVTYTASNFMPIYFQSVRGVTATMSSVWMLPGILSSIVVVIISGGLSTLRTSVLLPSYFIAWLS